MASTIEAPTTDGGGFPPVPPEWNHGGRDEGGDYHSEKDTDTRTFTEKVGRFLLRTVCFYPLDAPVYMSNYKIHDS